MRAGAANTPRTHTDNLSGSVLIPLMDKQQKQQSEHSQLLCFFIVLFPPSIIYALTGDETITFLSVPPQIFIPTHTHTQTGSIPEQDKGCCIAVALQQNGLLFLNPRSFYLCSAAGVILNWAGRGSADVSHTQTGSQVKERFKVILTLKGKHTAIETPPTGCDDYYTRTDDNMKICLGNKSCEIN